MKKGIFGYLTAALIGLFCVVSVHAQDTTTAGQHLKKGMKKTGHAIGKGAKTVGNKTSELASKGAAGVIDKVYDGKQGPNGEKIYINDKSKYYWIDKKGHRHYVTASMLKNKTS